VLETMIWDGQKLQLLDQRVLPHRQEYIDYKQASDLAVAIKDMVVRGAPAIGVAAAFGCVLAGRAAQKNYQPGTGAQWLSSMESDLAQLKNARPTAVNLFWAIGQAENIIADGGLNVPVKLENWAAMLFKQDIEINKKMGELGASLLTENSIIYTHCNAGALATCGYGTALGVIRSASIKNLVKHVYVDETRPWMQGSRLTAYELQQENIPCSLVIEGAAGHMMAINKVDWVIVGADRVAANGDVVNKIGTYNLAVLAKYHGVKFMVVAPSSTIDMSLANGGLIPIESRAAAEVCDWQGAAISPDGVHAENPAFDMTPAQLVGALVTEKGLIIKPNKKKLARLFRLEV
jgi:methylthioribose-1-phosphate isomerase